MDHVFSENGVAFGNFRNVCFNYNIEKGELTLVDPLGKVWKNQEHELREEMENELTKMFK